MHIRGINLNTAELHKHIINTFRIEECSCILTLNIYLKKIHMYTKVSRRITSRIPWGF